MFPMTENDRAAVLDPPIFLEMLRDHPDPRTINQRITAEQMPNIGTMQRSEILAELRERDVTRIDGRPIGQCKTVALQNALQQTRKDQA